MSNMYRSREDRHQTREGKWIALHTVDVNVCACLGGGCLTCRAGDHEAGEVGRGAHGHAHVNLADVLGYNHERFHSSLIVSAPG